MTRASAATSEKSKPPNPPVPVYNLPEPNGIIETNPLKPIPSPPRSPPPSLPPPPTPSHEEISPEERSAEELKKLEAIVMFL